MECPQCRELVKPGWKLCPFCGNGLPIVCPNPSCGQPVEPGKKFCTVCGTLMASPYVQSGATEPKTTGSNIGGLGQPQVQARPDIGVKGSKGTTDRVELTGLPATGALPHVEEALRATPGVAGLGQTATQVRPDIGDKTYNVTIGHVESAGPSPAGTVPQIEQTVQGALGAAGLGQPAARVGPDIGDKTYNYSIERLDVTQNVVIGGQKYTLQAFSDYTSYMFPPFVAQEAGGRTLVAKWLGRFPYAHELNRYIQSTHLDSLPSGVTRFLGCEIIGDSAYLTREFCTGQCLAEVINKQKALHEKEVLRIARGVTKLLLRVATPHGSPTPNNIFLTIDNQVALTDWGMEGMKERITTYEPRFRLRFEQQQRSSPYLALAGQVLPPTERDAYCLAVTVCYLMGVDVTKLPAGLGDGWQTYAVEFGRGPRPALIRVLEDTLNRKVRQLIAFHNRLGDVMFA